ncbi:accessory protein [Meliandou lophuromys virus]|uniref:Accessory protein n=1 Tax=Meliandou lophuromys virus TaxID=2940986 RepID=A0AAE9HTU1_9MONO|nr:accessory protein [Meliandou lophuromys virus]
MAFKLSSLFRAIGMRSKRRTEGPQSGNQEQKKEQQPGKLISSQKMEIPRDTEGEERAKMVILKAAAKKAIQIMDGSTQNHPYQIMLKMDPPTVEITKEGMMRILLNSIVEQGKTVDEKAMELVEEGLLSARELLALKEAIPLTRLMMVIMMGYVC